ncbi:MAG TPA: S8 family serine peptidase [Acidimicrobiia bacterium]
MLAALAAFGLSVPMAVPAHAAGRSVLDRPVAMYAVVPDGSSLKVVHFEAADGLAAQSLQARGALQGEVVSVDSAVHALDLGDPYRAGQWALPAVGYPDAWATTKGAGVTVAVVDSGVTASHEDLTGSVLSGTDYVSPGGNGWNDQFWHGTFVAGLIAAHLGNGRGIAGAAPSVRILPVRVLDGGGSGSSSNVAAGIIYSADHGARVINVSLGGTAADPGVHLAVQYAVSKGAVVVAAAGNAGESGSPRVYPAAFPEVIAVGAIDSHDQHAAFSNVGDYVDVVAPGVGVMSTYNATTHSYAVGEGTSFSAPYVSAEVALILATNPKLDPPSVRHVVEITARDLGAPGRDNTYGYGLASTRSLLRANTADANEGFGYWVVSADGAVRALGAAHFYGDILHRTSAPIVASARTPSGHGYWLAAADGSIFAFGDAHFYGSMHGRALNSPIVGMAATPSGHGYFLLGRDGGIFTFGDAAFHGSTGGRHLNAPVLDMTATPSGHGYWMVAADGGIFTFGDAAFHGSTGALHLNSPATSMTAANVGSGYWIVARDGGIFTFGVPFEGSVVSLGISSVVGVRIRSMPSGRGYLVLSREGGVYSFGSARFFGSATVSPAGPAVDLMTLVS